MTSGTTENDNRNRIPTTFLNDSTHSSDLSSTASSQDFVLINSPRNANDSYATDPSNNISMQRNSFEDDDAEDLNFSKNDDDDSEGSSYSFDTIDNSRQLRDDDDAPAQRYSKLRNYKHCQFTSPLTFRVMYIGSDSTNDYRRKIFLKFSDSLSQIVWDELDDNATGDIKLEKRFVVLPCSNKPLKVEYYEDSGVALCEADFTNGPYEKAFEYLRKQFEITDNDSNLVDLCVVFLPFDAKKFSHDLLSTMKKLQERVTLFLVIASSGQKYSTKLEREQKRREIVNKLQDYGIDIFMWKSDQILEDSGTTGGSNSRHETVYTKKIFTVDEFIKFDSSYVYEDLQLFRARAIDLRNDRLRYERAKRRTEQCDRIAGILRDFIVMCMILYTVYLFVSSVWHYAEFSVIPSEFAQSLQAISRASLKTPNGPHWIDIGNNDIDTQIEVLQESSNHYIFDVLNKKHSINIEKDVFDVIVTHNPPQILGRHSVLDLGDGRYSFDIDTSDAKGEIIIEIRKNGQVIKTFPWYPKKTGEKPIDTNISKKPDNISFLDTLNNAAFDISLKVNNALENVLDWSYESAVYIEDKAIIVSRYVSEQATIAAIVVWESLNYWIPFIWEKFIIFSDDYMQRLRYSAKRIKKGAYRMAHYIKDYFE
ncbi:17137_t:CDS:2 [Gigaspora margarita]|uniref:17137_t:CDS:1 n=1 Tax=Gigaspora margarita TaxID=4874 RepID=A0ABN7UTG5_GIGMA|nr:17137_t:CDS:2 [Gigaspora margarita]